MTVEEKKSWYISEFSEMPDSFDRLTYLIALAAKLRKPDELFLTDRTLVKDCQSKVWIYRNDNELIVYSDTLLIRGLLYMAVDIRENSDDWNEDSSLDIEFFNDCGIGNVITNNRRSGFAKVLAKISKN